MSNQQVNEEYVEIDLIEVLTVISNYKKMILTIVLIAVVSAWLVSQFFLTPLYSSEAVIRLGQNLDSYSQMSASEQRFNSFNYFEAVSQTLELDLSNEQINDLAGSNLEFEKLDSDILRLSYKHQDPQLSKEILTELVTHFEQESEVKYQQLLQRHQTHLQTLTEQQDNLEEEIDASEERLSDLNNSDLTTTEGLLIRNDLREQINRLEQRKSDLINQQYSLEDKIASYELAEIINYPVVPTTPVYPRVRLNIAIAFILALLFALFLVFLLHSLKEGNTKSKAKNSFYK